MAGKRTHGLSKHPLYNIWYCMKERCYNINSINYEYYGALGVDVCSEWLEDFMVFFNWAQNNNWEQGRQIDRLNAKIGYYPENCRIVTQLQNIIHRRKLKKKSSKYKGVYWVKSRKRWQAHIKCAGKSFHLGNYINELDAAKAYDNKALELYGKFAMINIRGE